MKHLNALYKVKKDTIFFNGEDCYKQDRLMKKRIGIVFQNPDTQVVSLTVLEDVMFGPLNLGIPYKEAERMALDSLRRLNIIELRHRNPYTLSGGELKRVTIAGILVMKPEILVLDEPFIGLDYPGVKSVLEAIVELKQEGETIIIITHDLEKVLKYPDRLIVLNKGAVVYDGKKEDSLDKLETWGIRRPYQTSVGDMTWLK